MKLCLLMPLSFVLLASCKGGAASPTPEQVAVDGARGAIVLAAKATLLADQACDARVKVLEADALKQPDKSKARLDGLGAALRLGEDCSRVAHATADALAAGEDALDARDAVVDGKTACAALAGIEGLRSLADFVARAGGPSLPIVEQAIHLAMPLAALASGGACPLPPASSTSTKPPGGA